MTLKVVPAHAGRVFVLPDQGILAIDPAMPRRCAVVAVDQLMEHGAIPRERSADEYVEQVIPSGESLLDYYVAQTVRETMRAAEERTARERRRARRKRRVTASVAFALGALAPSPIVFANADITWRHEKPEPTFERVKVSDDLEMSDANRARDLEIVPAPTPTPTPTPTETAAPESTTPTPTPEPKPEATSGGVPQTAPENPVKETPKEPEKDEPEKGNSAPRPEPKPTPTKDPEDNPAPEGERGEGRDRDHDNKPDDRDRDRWPGWYDDDRDGLLWWLW